MRLRWIFASHISLFCASLAAALLMLTVWVVSIHKLDSFYPFITSANSSNGGLRIKQRNPVVNEKNSIKLTAMDVNGQPVTGVKWESGSPDIARVDPISGEVEGVKQGFATITAQIGDESASIFVVVTRVTKGKGIKVPGDTKVDSRGALYISNPVQNVIYKADKALGGEVKLFAGKRSVAGLRNGSVEEALFAGPTALAVDNNAQGGVYIADTLNHSIRKISFNNRVETILGKGAPGLSAFDDKGKVSVEGTLFSSPRGITSDVGGNLYISDTDNHAIYYMDFTRRQIILLAGAPGLSGKQDGPGRQARFKRPAGIALSSDGNVLTVADEDNNRVRMVEILRKPNGELEANVSTLGAASSSQGVSMAKTWALDQLSDEIAFDKPQSVSIDGVGNIYVVDKVGAKVVTRPIGQRPQIIELAQPEVSFNEAVSVVVKGREAFVLDAEATEETEAVKIVTVGEPQIDNVTPDNLPLEGGMDVVINGHNFAPESIVTFGDSVVNDAVVVSATEIRFRATPQVVPGIRTISVLTRGGIAQHELSVKAKLPIELGVGEITTVVGGVSFSGDGGKATEANLIGPRKVALDSAGNIFIADTNNNRVRRIDVATRIITTVAGGGASLKDGDPANIARLYPLSIALDADGNLFIADGLTQSVRRVDALTRTISTVASGPTLLYNGDGNPASMAGFGAAPTDIEFDRAGNLYVLIRNSVRRIDVQTGIITTVAGAGAAGFDGDGGIATYALLNKPQAIAIDSTGNIFIADTFNHRVRKVDARTGIITTVAGNGNSSVNELERDGKIATQVAIVSPKSVAVDSEGSLYVLDAFVSRVELRTGVLRVIKQKPPRIRCLRYEVPDLIFPAGIMALDGTGSLYIPQSRRIRRLEIDTGIVTTEAGKELADVDNDKELRTLANLGKFHDVEVDTEGNIYILDYDNSVVRRMDARTGVLERFAGVGHVNCVDSNNGDGGDANKAVLVQAIAMALDKQRGHLFIADLVAATVRRVDVLTSKITTVAGNGEFGNDISGDGGPAIKARLGGLTDITVDPTGNLLIAASNRIRRVDIKTGIIRTIAGTGNANFSGDGRPAIQAGMSPVSIAVDENGDIYLADQFIPGGGRVRRIRAGIGIIETVAGAGGSVFSGEGGLPEQANLGFVRSIALGSCGKLFIGAAQYRDNLNIEFVPRIWQVNIGNRTIIPLLTGKDYILKGDGGPLANASLVGLPQLTVSSNNLLFTDVLGDISAVRFIKLDNGSPVWNNLVITGANYHKPTLVISGQGFGSSGAQVKINGLDVTAQVSQQFDGRLVLVGSRKKLNLHKQGNRVVVTNDKGVSFSHPF
ncbi:MAG: IPT/TIG domain-containing protein [Acidobacteriota bacterium]